MYNLSENELIKTTGFEIDIVSEIENSLKQIDCKSTPEFYLDGQKEEAINTSLQDFYQILKSFSNSHKGPITICDIGASYGKMAFVAQAYFPNIKVISIEPVKKRIDYAINKLKNSKHVFINDRFRQKYVSEFAIDYYFLYFPVGVILDEIIEAIESPIIAIESHGELLNRLGHSFKQKRQLTKLISPRHNPNSFIFSDKCESVLYQEFKEFLSKESDLILITNEKPWYADKADLKYFFDEEDQITLELMTPPRTIHFSNNLETIKSSELDTNVQEIISMRREGKQIDGCFIRKIFVDGSYELSSGVIKK